MSVTFAQGFSAAGVAAGLVALVKGVVLFKEGQFHLPRMEVGVGVPGAALAAVGAEVGDRELELVRMYDVRPQRTAQARQARVKRRRIEARELAKEQSIRPVLGQPVDLAV